MESAIKEAASSATKNRKKDPSTTDIDCLINNLQDQLGLHEHLELVLQREIELTADCQVTDLESIQQRKMDIASRLYEIEADRKKLITDIVSELAVPEELRENITLKTLAPFIKTGAAQKLLNLQAKLKELIAKIQGLGQKTVAVSRARLISLRTTTDQLDKWMAYHTFYSKQGGLKNTAQSRFLSRHI